MSVLVGLIGFVGVASACGSSQREATRQERIARTQAVLEEIFVPGFAASEAVRLVDECDRLPESLFGFEVEDPPGPELFPDYDAARDASNSSAEVITMAVHACTREAQQLIDDLSNI